MESELCYVVSALLDTRHDTASIVFFKITNTSARNKIIEGLLQHIHGSKFDLYWHGQPGGGSTPRVPGMFNLLGRLDNRRNEIAHWHPVQTASSTVEGDTIHSEDLRPAFFWARSNAAPITTKELNEFIGLADFVQRSLAMFWLVIRHPQKFSEDELQAWLQIFQQPALYPPSADHPLAQKPQG